ncbi:ice-binding family protein [Actinospongicola halichondriae]|uniref:ice-binding family protein n=1 Tax=Actinospongicola halichondriae TaxID=3236844 RepID=UPI003D3BC90B
MAVSPAGAATPSVDLGAADNFAVLAGSGITNAGPTTISGDVGTFPTPTETGFGSLTLTGTDHAGDAVTQQAKDDLVTAYDDVAGRGPTTEIATDLAGQTLVPGIYDAADGTFGNTGVLTLDGQGETDPVFVFQTATTLITGSGSSVVLVNGADACNVYWKVGSSATLGTASELTGNVLPLASITLTTAATLEGRALARNGAVTMDTNTITRSACAAPTDTTSTVESSDTTTASESPVTFTATVEGGDGSTPTGIVEFFDDATSIGTAPLGADGTAEFTTTALSEGSHTITVVYLGAPGYGSSTSTDLTQIVQTPSSPPGPAVPGIPTTSSAPATPTATRAPATPATPAFTG